MQKQIQPYQDTMKALYAINSDTLRKLTNLQFGFFNTSVASSLEQAKIISSQNSYQCSIVAGAQMTGENYNATLDVTRQTIGILSEARKKIVDWADKGTTVAFDRVGKSVSTRVAAKPVKKANAGKK